jgi:hypothetical protein
VAYTFVPIIFTTVFSQFIIFRFIPKGFGHIVIHWRFSKQLKQLTLRGRCCCSLPTPRRPLEIRPLPSRCISLTISMLNTNNSEARARRYLLYPLLVNQSFFTLLIELYLPTRLIGFSTLPFLKKAIRSSTTKVFYLIFLLKAVFYTPIFTPHFTSILVISVFVISFYLTILSIRY